MTASAAAFTCGNWLGGSTFVVTHRAQPEPPAISQQPRQIQRHDIRVIPLLVSPARSAAPGRERTAAPAARSMRTAAC